MLKIHSLQVFKNAEKNVQRSPKNAITSGQPPSICRFRHMDAKAFCYLEWKATAKRGLLWQT